MARAFITYDLVTEESAADGEAAERGYAAPGGWHFPIPLDGIGGAERDEMALEIGEALRWAAGRSWECGHGPFRSFYCIDNDEDFERGGRIYYALHLEGVTDASAERVARLLGCGK